MRASDYEILFDLPDGECDARALDGVRTVTVRAGRSMEIMVHPTNRLTADARREARERRTTPAMARINARNVERHMMRLIEANFPATAYVVTGTYSYPVEDYGLCAPDELSDIYDARGLPWDAKRVKMDVWNWLKKIKRRVKKSTGNAGDFRWIVRIEEGKQPPEQGLPPKYHFHAIIEAPGVSRETIESLWTHGHTRCERFDTENDGAARLARYLNKQRSGGRWWSHSRNLVIPQPRVSDRKISRRRLARIAADVQRSGREILEALYPGYRVVELPDVRYSDFVPGAYIYARLRASPEGCPQLRGGTAGVHAASRRVAPTSQRMRKRE